MKLSPHNQARDDEARALFRPGLYRHYKGGEYSAIGLTRHHDSGRSYVLYSSMLTGSLRIRPLVKVFDLSQAEAEPDQDCWNDELVVDRLQQGPPVRRFRYVAPLP